jgi:succinate-semialdehyde dehydrogenase/glutarate-semialdehyde dehydrogenase
VSYPDVQLYIDGTSVPGAERGPISTTEEAIGNIACAGRADLDRALDAVQRDFSTWSRVLAFERFTVMRRAADLLRSRIEDIAMLVTLEQGKPARTPGVQQLVVKEPVGPVAASTS